MDSFDLGVRDTPTETQLGLMVAIWEYRRRRKISPTMTELGREAGVSRQAIYNRLVRMKGHGWVTWKRRDPRSLLLTEAGVGYTRRFGLNQGLRAVNG